MRLKKLIDYALKLGATDAEIFVRKNIVKGAKVETGTFKAESRRSIEASVRIGVGRNIASQYLTSTDENQLLRTIDKTIKMAKAIGEDPYWSGLPHPSQPLVRSLYYDMRIEKLDIEDMIHSLKELNKRLIEYDGRIKGVLAEIEITRQEVEFINSNGIEFHEETSGEEFVVSITAKENNNYMSSFEYKRSRSLFNDFNRLGYKVADKVLRFLSAKKLGGTVKKALFDPLSISAILSHSLVYGLSADQVLEGASPLRGKLNTKISSDNVTVYDDGTIPGGWRTSIYDDEGVPRKRTLLIDKGVLRSYLHNHYTASRMNLESTGNAERVGTIVTVHASNIVFEEGRLSSIEVLNDMKEGVYISGYPLSAHTINTSTGDVSVVFQEAYYIDKFGEMKPLKPVTLSGNIYDALEDMTPLQGITETPYSMYLPPILSERFIVR